MNSKIENKVKILWSDSVLYKNGNIPSKLTDMETTGILEKENEKYLIIREPINIKKDTGEKHPTVGEPNFYFIPKAVVKKVTVKKYKKRNK